MKIYDDTVSSGTVYSDPLVMYKDKGFYIGVSWATGLTLTSMTLQLGIKLPHEDGGGYLWADSDETFPTIPANSASSSGQSWDIMNADAVRVKMVYASGAGGNVKIYGKVK